jgi:two-component system sensor histidine kinase KdpD
MHTVDRRLVVRLGIVGSASLALATLVIALLQSLGVPNASAVYLAAVVATAFVAGTWGAVVAAVASFLLYDYLFVLPLYTFTVADPGEWLNLIVLLFIGIVVGQLVALQRSRAEIAIAREREARALFQVSRALATRTSTPAVLPTIADILRTETAMRRIWVALGPDDARERVAADTDPSEKPAIPGLYQVLQRTPDESAARWTRVHQVAPARGGQRVGREAYRVRMEAASRLFGSIWAFRDRSDGEPDATETRLISAAADQVGQALAQDRLAAESRAAEIARQSDYLKSALLQSVSHDLRTPLATIRAAAGTLRPGSGLSEHDQQESADAIDREVEYLNRLVTNLLDLSRIEAGALRAERDVFELDDLVRPTVERLRRRLGDRSLTIDVSAPPVEVDPVFLDEALINALENAIKYTPPTSTIRIVTEPLPDDGRVRLTVEDDGPGVPDQALSKVFDKFYRVPGVPGGSRSGTGIGLAVVRGLVEAMGGRASARRSELGGLAIDIDLVAAAVPAPPNVLAQR